MAKHKKMLKKVQSAAAAALEAGPMKQRKLASKVFKKVHSKYADVTEQQVSELLQQLLQGDSVFQLQGPSGKVALNPAGAQQQQQQQQPPAGSAAATAADQQQQKKRKHQHEQQQQQEEGNRQHKKHKPKHVQQQQQEHSVPVSSAAALFGVLADQAEQQQTQQQSKQQSKHQKAQGKQQTHKQPQAAVAAAGGARLAVLAAAAAAPAAADAAAADGRNAAAKGVAAKFAQRLKAASNAAPAAAPVTDRVPKQPVSLAPARKLAAAAAAAASEDSADVEPSGRPKKPRAQKEVAAAAIAADAAAAAEINRAEQKAKRESKKAVAAAAAAAAGGGNSLEDLMGDEADTWAEDYNRKNLKHGTFEPHEAEEVQEYVSAFARSRGLKEDQPGTCSWLLDLKGNGITKRMLTDAIYKPCLPHRARKSVWQYMHRIYPPYLWGPWTEAEDAQLRALQAEKGNRWKEIGAVLGRHPEGVADRWNNLGKGVVRQMGRWTPDEEERLKSLIAKYKRHLELVSRPRTISETNVPAAAEGARFRADLTRDDIDWNWVASQMGNRTAKQCNDKWFTSLAPSMLERGEWDIQQDKQLVEALHSGLQEGRPEWEIDWEELVPGRSMEQCKRRWRVLLSFLPLEQRRTFTGAVAAAAARFKRSKSKGSGRSAAAGGGSGSSGDAAAAAGGGRVGSPKQKQQEQQQQQQAVMEQEPQQPRLRQLQQPPWMQTAQPAQQQQQQQGRPSQQQHKTFVRQKSNVATQQQEPAAAEHQHQQQQQDEQPVSPPSPPQHHQQQHKEKKKHKADRQHKEGKHKRRREQDQENTKQE